MHGSVAEKVQAEKMDGKKTEPLPDEEEKQKLIEEALIDEIAIDMQRWVKKKDGQPYCCICKKRATATHMTSGEHLKRVEEDA